MPTDRQAQHTARLAWLRERPALLARLPSLQDDVDARRSEALDEAVRGVCLVRLYQASGRHVRDGIRRLVSELRGLPVPPGAQTWRHYRAPAR